MKTLIVDDDLVVADVVSFVMRRAGFETAVCHDGQSAVDCWQRVAPDLVILDLNLPGADGLAVCRRLRALGDTPIIILSVRGDDEDIVHGLEVGADDYIVKPFSPRELVARCNALLRRAGTPLAAPGPVIVGDLNLDVTRREVHWRDKPPAELTKLECRLLEVLMRNSGQILPSDTIINYVWGPAGGDRVMLKKLVSRLRRKIEPQPDNPRYLETLAGVGYGFVPPHNGTEPG
jgi:DNA-binding response OmpR family regulator